VEIDRNTTTEIINIRHLKPFYNNGWKMNIIHPFHGGEWYVMQSLSHSRIGII
jgi:hypothetical protein